MANKKSPHNKATSKPEQVIVEADMPSKFALRSGWAFAWVAFGVGAVTALFSARGIPYWAKVSLIMFAGICFSTSVHYFAMVKSHRKGGVGKVKIIWWTAIWVAALLFSILSWETSVKVTFKESPELSWYREQIITYDISNMHDYFVSLDIPVPDDLPPIGIQTGSGSGTCGAITPPGLPLYRAELVLGESSVRNRQTVSSCYAGYVVDEYMGKSLKGVAWPIPEDQTGAIDDYVFLSAGFSNYLAGSFWGQKPKEVFASLFWDIRDILGKKFTDDLVAATLKATSDSPRQGQAQDPFLYLAAQIKIGESVVDNECSQWPSIESVLVKYGIDSSKLRGQDLTNAYVSTACLEEWKN